MTSKQKRKIRGSTPANSPMRTPILRRCGAGIARRSFSHRFENRNCYTHFVHRLTNPRQLVARRACRQCGWNRKRSAWCTSPGCLLADHADDCGVTAARFARMAAARHRQLRAQQSPPACLRSRRTADRGPAVRRRRALLRGPESCFLDLDAHAAIAPRFRSACSQCRRGSDRACSGSCTPPAAAASSATSVMQRRRIARRSSVSNSRPSRLRHDGHAVIADRAAENNEVARHARAGRQPDAVGHDADPGRVDENAVAFAPFHHLGVAGDDGEPRRGGPRHRMRHPAQISMREPSSMMKPALRNSGRAPPIARSFTVPCTASEPMSPPGKNSGCTTKESVVNASRALRSRAPPGRPAGPAPDSKTAAGRHRAAVRRSGAAAAMAEHDRSPRPEARDT